MKSFLFNWIIPRSLRLKDVRISTVRAQYGRIGGWVSIIVNIFLFVAKLIVGLLINSIALVADSIHSLSDVSTSIIVIIGYRISEKPADREHPFGHQRAEYVATLIIAVLLAVAGVEFIRSAVLRLHNPGIMTVTYGVLLFILLTVVIKAWLGELAKYIGKLINSQMLRADALHHYTDSISSILVLLAIGGSKLGYTFLDGVGGILVGVLLICAGVKIAREAVDILIGKPPAPELVHKIQQICHSVENVINSHDIVVHSYGNQIFISAHVEVDQKESSIIAHDIGDAVEKMLAEQLGAYCTVHVDPVDIDSEDVKLANRIVRKIIEISDEISDFHDLRLINRPDHRLVIFDLVPVNPGIKIYEDFKVCKQLNKSLKKAFLNCEIKVNIDPIYIFN
ncbi:MAG: cation transporter [Candidatus Marinimicrobia bacterium]|nr:cation transporter [Candidatus Neomarinimicrobiota bacterium]